MVEQKKIKFLKNNVFVLQAKKIIESYFVGRALEEYWKLPIPISNSTKF